LDDDGALPVIDSTSWGGEFYPKTMMISPLVVKNRWAKKVLPLMDLGK
jgi:hypothetical protein